MTVTSAELDIVRRAFAMQVMAAAGVVDARVEAAFAAVRREHFLGPGPWPILRWRGYAPSPSDDPVYLYTDDVIGILPERHLNNGKPSLHAILLASAAPQSAEHVVHVGAGVGYYTAILAELVGPSGVVTAIEFDQGLASRAATNFSRSPNVRVLHGDGAVAPFDPADVVYISAGATHPAASWLDGLKDGGRLILPLTTDEGFGRPVSSRRDLGNIQRHGAVFRIQRQGSGFLARRISAVAIFPCEGARDAESEEALAVALGVEGGDRVTRLYRRDDLPEEQCWRRAPGWCLAYR